MPTDLQRYYANRDVQARMLEFMGGTSLSESSCVFITAADASPDVRFEPRPVADLWTCLDAGSEVGRSLWDRQSLIVHLDVEYVNFDFPAEPFLDPTRAFQLQQPAVDGIRKVLLTRGILPLHLLSGRGHHFVWQLRRDSSAVRSLASLGRVSDPLQRRYRRPFPPHGERVEPGLGAAFAGLGLVMEFLAQCVLDASAQSEIPVMLTAVEVGPGARGREIISIDVSEYGDPLHTRGIRMPFSAYLKPHQQRYTLGLPEAERFPRLFLIPLCGMDEREGLRLRCHCTRVAALARHTSAKIPDHSEEMGELIAAYDRSDLAHFHDDFYREHHDPPERWPDSYDRTPLEPLPPCARWILEEPNELLLKPAGLQHLTRVLLASGWHPRHVAGLVRSKYERDYGWGDVWYQYDASTRADFYVRLFAGLIATGRDALVDFNCRSCQEKRYCPVQDCGENLVEWRTALLARRYA